MNIVVAFLVACVVAVVLADDVIPVLSHTELHDDSGQYSLSFEAGNGISVSEQGVLKPNADGTDQVLVKQGSYQYTSPDGTPVSLTYTADETGFHPQGAHLPVAATI